VFRAIGRPDMIDDPRFRTNADRVRNAEACEAPLRDFIRARGLNDALKVFEQAEVTAAPVYDVEQFLADPHVRARQIVVDLPDSEMGSVPMHAVVPRLSGTPGAIRSPAPKLGEHTQEILGALGMTSDELARLREKKAI
jgi:formyl-CoA transferase